MHLLQQSHPALLEWPNGRLDLAKLSQSGWQTTPIDQFILKVHSRCNLACSYCYVYEKGDESWRHRPRRMDEETLIAAASRIGEHARAHRSERIEIIFHGGEPLLVGADYLGHAIDLVREALPTDTALDATLQSNGVLLSELMLDQLLRRRIRVGVSIDGTRVVHDRHRRYPDGRPSSPAVEKALARLASPKYRSIYAGLLCVVDLQQDPLAAYERLSSFEPPRIDFLLPHGDWTSRPPGRPDDTTTPYADWLLPVFDRWYHSRGKRSGVRLFEEIIQLLLGGRSRSEIVGLSPVTALVIETDGAIEQVDSLRTAYPGASATGLHVRDNSIDEALVNPNVAARQLGFEALAADCRQCRFGRICGGGFYGNRYRAGAGFENPSVYCPDLYAVIDRIRQVLIADIRSHNGSA